MRKNLLHVSLIAVLFSATGNAQNVGINTTDPKTTLDIVGKPDEASVLDGILIPRVTAIQLKAKTYTTDQKSALIYVTDAFANDEDATDQVELVSDPGIYQFDGSKWLPFSATEIDTLYDVVERGNYAGRYISFTGDSTTKEGTITGSLGYKSSTKSYWFGNFNQSQTGQNNFSFGQNAGATLTTGYSNTLFGNDAGSKITTGFENTFVGKDAGKNLLTGMWNVGIGESAFFHATDATFNVAVGDGAMMNTVGRMYHNVAVGSNAFKHSKGKNNTIIGNSAGYRIEGDSNVIIGSGAAERINYSTRGVLNNKLVIHAQSYADDGSNGGAGRYTENVLTNTLIYGDFADRWLRINGKFQVSPTYISTADSTYTKSIRYNPSTGDFAVGDLDLPVAPTTGTYTLKSINGTIQWIAD